VIVAYEDIASARLIDPISRGRAATARVP
jgi:hypothetical protein